MRHFIKPFVSALPSYIQDTVHVHTRTDEIKNIGDAFMVTMDVTFLYSNIKQEECFEAVNHFLQSRTNDNPPNEFILMLTEWTLNNSVFVFQDKLFRQKRTAMGSRKVYPGTF